MVISRISPSGTLMLTFMLIFAYGRGNYPGCLLLSLTSDGPGTYGGSCRQLMAYWEVSGHGSPTPAALRRSIGSTGTRISHFLEKTGLFRVPERTPVIFRPWRSSGELQLQKQAAGCPVFAHFLRLLKSRFLSRLKRVFL